MRTTSGSEDSSLYRLYVFFGKLRFNVAPISSPSVSVVGESVTLLGALYTVTFSVFLIPLCVVIVIVAVPAFTPLSRPSSVTVTIFLLLVLKLYAAWLSAGTFCTKPDSSSA